VDTLASRLMNLDLPEFRGVRAGTYDPAGDTQDVRSMILERLQQADRPDRYGIAANAFELMRQRSDPAYDQALRKVGQKNAALGRLGSGMVTSELMDVTAQRERDLSFAQRDLALEAAGLSLQDELSRLGAAQDVYGQFSGSDRADAGLKMDLRNEARGERQAKLAYGLDRADLQRGIFGDMAGLESQRFGQDVTGRNEYRAERDYQSQQAQQAIENAARQRMLEEQIFGNDFDRNLRATSIYGGLGYGGDPSGAYFTGAGQLGAQSAQGAADLGQAATNWSYNEWLRKHGMMN
jgi:hypothetical protein